MPTQAFFSSEEFPFPKKSSFTDLREHCSSRAGGTSANAPPFPLSRSSFFLSPLFSRQLWLCLACVDKYKNRNYCPTCGVTYDPQDNSVQAVGCSACEFWVHAKCEGLSSVSAICHPILCLVCSKIKTLSFPSFFAIFVVVALFCFVFRGSSLLFSRFSRPLSRRALFLIDQACACLLCLGFCSPILYCTSRDVT